MQATYRLEGNGALVFSCIDVLASLAAGIQTAYFPNLVAVAARLSAGNLWLGQQFMQYGRDCIEPGLQYFHTRFAEDLSDSAAAFNQLVYVYLRR